VISDRETRIEERIASAEYLLARFNITDLGPSLAGLNATEVVERANDEWYRQQSLPGPGMDEAAPTGVESSIAEAAQDQANSGQTVTEQEVAPAADRYVTGQTGTSGDDNLSIDMMYDEPADEQSANVLDSNADAQRQTVVEEGERPVAKLPRAREEDALGSDSIVPAQQTSQAVSAPPQAATDESAEKFADSKGTALAGDAVNMSGSHPCQKIQSCIKFWVKADCAGDTYGKSHT
jgi:hypothetical protein